MVTHYFKEPKLNLSLGGEFVVRAVTYSWYAILGAATPFLFLSGVPQLQSLSLLLAIFLADRLIHLGEGEESIQETKGDKINLALFLTSPAYRLLNYAFRKSLSFKENFYLLLFRELLRTSDVREAFRRLDVQIEDLTRKIEEALARDKGEWASVTRDALLKTVETLAMEMYDEAKLLSEKFLPPRMFLVAVAASGDASVSRVLQLFNVSLADLRGAIILGRWRGAFRGVRRMPAVLGGFAHRPKFIRHRVMNRAWTARPTPTLDQFSTDLTDLARDEKIGLLVGHGKEFEHMLNVISRPGKPNALLVGDPGAGKSTMIAHLAFRMVKDEVPAVLFDKRLVSLEIGDLVANASADVLSGRIQKIVEEVLLAGNIVLFIPAIHDLFRTAEAKSLSAIDLLLPVVKNEAIPVIGESYPREFKQFIEPRTDFLEQFEVVEVNEISEEEALIFLVYSSLVLEREFGVLITFRALRKAVELAHRFFHQKPLPGSALDLLKQALGKAQGEKQKMLVEGDVIEIAERQSKIPISGARGAETEKLLNLEAFIHNKLVNQDAAVKAVAQALREYRSGLARQGGPIATFLFVGPTGVGKTELSKILTEIQFGSRDLMHRFDMSEYQDKQSIFRLIGTPDGEKTGTLTDAVRETPYSLVLLDEFEKAHPDVLNLFLQVFDDGRLTDSLGRTVDFQNTIIIATSNAHSELIKSEIERGKKIEDISDEIKKKLSDYFKPELINRFSNIIVFRNLNLDEIYKVAGFLVAEVAAQLRTSQGVELRIEDGAIRKLAELGYSPVFGARPLRQVISDKIKSVLAEKILKKEIIRGNTISVSTKEDEFVFVTK